MEKKKKKGGWTEKVTEKWRRTREENRRWGFSLENACHHR